jgi:hypothetical protein
MCKHTRGYADARETVVFNPPLTPVTYFLQAQKRTNAVSY